MSLDKKYLKSKPVCKVKFTAPPELVKSAKKIYLAGEFNEWDFTANQLKKQKNGTFATTLELAAGQDTLEKMALFPVTLIVLFTIFYFWQKNKKPAIETAAVH